MCGSKTSNQPRQPRCPSHSVARHVKVLTLAGWTSPFQKMQLKAIPVEVRQYFVRPPFSQLFVKICENDGISPQTWKNPLNNPKHEPPGPVVFEVSPIFDLNPEPPAEWRQRPYREPETRFRTGNLQVESGMLQQSFQFRSNSPCGIKHDVKVGEGTWFLLQSGP